MKAKIYRTEYRWSEFHQYSTNLDDAREELKKNGYVQKQEINVLGNEADLWERPEDQVFNASKARIIEITCINDVPDFEYRIAAAMEVVKKMTFAEIYDMACPTGDSIPGVLIQEDYQRQSTRFIFKDYFVDVHNDVVIKIERW